MTLLRDSGSAGCSPGKAPPGAGQRAEDGGEGQSREEGVEGEVEQALHPVIAQAFQRVNVVLGGRGQTSKSTTTTVAELNSRCHRE